MSERPVNKPLNIDAFIARWQGLEGGAERANYAMFLTELCAVLEVEPPQPAAAGHEHNDYVFERAVSFKEAGDKIGHGRIDLYKRGHFVLEAKQSRQKGGAKAVTDQQELFEAPTHAGRHAASRRWDILMVNARRQAEDYARALPDSHEWPPFIIVCDVGRTFEIFADFTGKGRNYTQFPDRQSFRIDLNDLRHEHVRQRLRLIWLDPHSLDPTRKAARATREVAERLASITRLLEQRGQDPEQVAQFLMRCLFTMFAESVKLLPAGSFALVLEKCVADPAKFRPMVSQLWAAMNTGDFAFAIETRVKRFNGEFFRNPVVLDLQREEIGELLMAATKQWRDVEPAIFGSLLEGALDPKERSKLGAHYTPRAYVERLVIPTIMEPLRADWRDAAVTAEKLVAEGKREQAIQTVVDFHDQLCLIRVLDPACGTGNFLYVAMELIKQLEDEVIEALVSLGGQQSLALSGHVVDPHQFLGIEINPRAAAIAELVLWIGFLQIHYRSTSDHPSEPILKAFHNIECRDAVLTWDGYPLPKIVDGLETYPNPRQPDWPMADFIVGNPPFLGKGEPMREAFGDPYLNALWQANPKVNKSADFVMFWWDHSAAILRRSENILRRFGLVTTNSIDQFFNRRILEKHIAGQDPISLILAIPDHPWTKATKNAAAVRIAMTVADRGVITGQLLRLTQESGLDTDNPKVDFDVTEGLISPALTVGARITDAKCLISNSGLASMGPALGGRGFVINGATARHLSAHTEKSATILRPLVTGKDITERDRGRFVIDARSFSSESELRMEAPLVYQHLLETVRPIRAKNNDEKLQREWWLFRRSNADFSSMTQGLPKYAATVETTKHRIFVSVPGNSLVEHGVIGIGHDDDWILGVVSSHVHVAWALAQGGTLENRPRYNKLVCFDNFPFPEPDETEKAEIARLAEALDAHRKRIQSEHPDITLTEMYNVLEKLRASTGPAAWFPSPLVGEGARRADEGLRGAPAGAASVQWTDPSREGHESNARMASPHTLTERETDIKSRALILILRELHDELDAAVVKAYGWPQGLSDDDILTRLVALNKTRAAEEAAGHVRWLRPDYQIPRFGSATQKAQKGQLDLVAPEDKAKPSFPADERRRTAAIFTILAGASGPLGAADIARRFRQGRKVEKDIALTLQAFVRFGDLSSTDGGKTFVLRQVA